MVLALAALFEDLLGELRAALGRLFRTSAGYLAGAGLDLAAAGLDLAAAGLDLAAAGLDSFLGAALGLGFEDSGGFSLFLELLEL
jgi:hypothetical protein